MTLSLLVAFAVSAGMLCLLLSPRVAVWFLDQPNPRSLHVSPVPRTGGLGVVPGLVVGMLLAGGDLLLIALAGGLMLLSVLDDWKHLPASWRLLGHLAAAAALVLIDFPAAGWIGPPVLVLAVV